MTDREKVCCLSKRSPFSKEYKSVEAIAGAGGFKLDVSNPLNPTLVEIEKWMLSVSGGLNTQVVYFAANSLGATAPEIRSISDFIYTEVALTNDFSGMTLYITVTPYIL